MPHARIILLAALAVSATAPAFAQDAVDAKPDRPAAKKDKMVCRTDRATGSLVRVDRYCATQDQWREHEDKTRDELDRWDRDAMERKTR